MFSLQEMLRPWTLTVLVVFLAMAVVMLVRLRPAGVFSHQNRWRSWYSPIGAKRGLRLAAAVLALWCVWVVGFIKGSVNGGSPREVAAALSSTAAAPAVAKSGVPSSAAQISGVTACHPRRLDI